MNNCVVHKIIFFIFVSTIGPLDEKQFALQKRSTQKTLLFLTANADRRAVSFTLAE